MCYILVFISVFPYLYMEVNKMNMNDYITKHWAEIYKKVRRVTKNHQNTDDLLNDLVMTLLEKPSEYQNNLLENDKVQHWIVSSAHTQMNSKTSPFFYKYKSFSMRTIPYEDWRPVEEDVDVVGTAEEIKGYISSRLETYNVYTRTLASEHILNNKSYSEISREYNINRRFISETITPVKNELFEKVKKKWNY